MTRKGFRSAVASTGSDSWSRDPTRSRHRATGRAVLADFRAEFRRAAPDGRARADGRTNGHVCERAWRGSACLSWVRSLEASPVKSIPRQNLSGHGPAPLPLSVHSSVRLGGAGSIRGSLRDILTRPPASLPPSIPKCDLLLRRQAPVHSVCQRVMNQ